MLLNTLAMTVSILLNFWNPHPLLPSSELIINYLICGLGGILFGVYTGYIKLMALENGRLIRIMSRTDSELHILNRKSFFEDYAFSKNQDQLCGIFMIDVNRFKLLNDTYGHQFGDKCLEIIAKALTDAEKNIMSLFTDMEEMNLSEL